MKKQEKDVVYIDENLKGEVVAVEDNDFMYEDAGMGTEGADEKSFATPFLTVLQGLSPQLEYLDNARVGNIINTLTEEVYKEAFVIPCGFQRRYLRWGNRNTGGGFKGEYNPVQVENGEVEGVTRTPDGKLTIDGDDLKDTRNHFVLVRSNNGSWQPAIISLSSTQIKKSKRWMSLIQSCEFKTKEGKKFTPPSFANIYKIGSQKEENSKGSWHGITVELSEKVSEKELYEAAKEFSLKVSKGEVKMAAPEADSGVELNETF